MCILVKSYDLAVALGIRMLLSMFGICETLYLLSATFAVVLAYMVYYPLLICTWPCNSGVVMLSFILIYGGHSHTYAGSLLYQILKSKLSCDDIQLPLVAER